MTERPPASQKQQLGFLSSYLGEIRQTRNGELGALVVPDKDTAASGSDRNHDGLLKSKLWET